MNVVIFEMGVIGTNCYLVYDENKNAVLIDCDGHTGALYRYIEEHELKLTHILLTHGHYDHIGAVSEVQEHYGCKVVAPTAERALLQDASINCSLWSPNGAIAIDADIWVQGGDSIDCGTLHISVLETPGHTAGSVCYICENAIFSGDTLFAGSCGRTDLPTGDWQTILTSLRKLRDMQGDFTVYPGHGPATTLEQERRTNPYM